MAKQVSADRSRQVAESARERGWARPSFGRELFLGRLAVDLIHPFPRQQPADIEKGEAFLKRLSVFSARPSTRSRSSARPGFQMP